MVNNLSFFFTISPPLSAVVSCWRKKWKIFTYTFTHRDNLMRFIIRQFNLIPAKSDVIIYIWSLTDRETSCWELNKREILPFTFLLSSALFDSSRKCVCSLCRRIIENQFSLRSSSAKIKIQNLWNPWKNDIFQLISFQLSSLSLSSFFSFNSQIPTWMEIELNF